jgi:hypothetical protein
LRICKCDLLLRRQSHGHWPGALPTLTASSEHTAAGSIEMRAPFRHCGRWNHQSRNHHRSLAKLSLHGIVVSSRCVVTAQPAPAQPSKTFRPPDPALARLRFWLPGFCVSKKSVLTYFRSS